MNILFLTTHLNMGGITRYLLTLSKGLQERSHQVHIISSGGEMDGEFESLGAKLLQLNIRTKSELDLKLYFAYKPIHKYIIENKIDIVHAQTRVTQVLGARLNKKVNIPYISTCHGYFKTRLSRRLWPCWGNVIAISKAVYDHLRFDFHIPEEWVHLVRHGIELNDFPQVSYEVKMENRKQFCLKDEPVIGMVARLSDVKGQDILIEAMPQIIQELPNTKLLLFGEGPMRHQLISLVDKLNLRKQVEFYPIANQVFSSLSVMDVVAAPSRQEGLGLSVMEAQACGLPVVASKVGGIPSIIEDGKTGVLVENIKTLPQKILGLLKDEKRRKTLGASARNHAQNHYSVDTMIEETLAVYQKVKGK